MTRYLYPIESLPYDPHDPSSVLRYSKELIGKSLREHMMDKGEEGWDVGGKGDFGRLLERVYYLLENDNEAAPDIPESGIELKSGNIMTLQRGGKRIKERLKLSSINYMEGFAADSFLESSLWPKVEHILLMLFMQGRDAQGKALSRIDEECSFSDLLSWDAEEIRQMSEDWAAIKQMVTSNRANDLSEGMTWYLGACTSGANASDVSDAPGGKAKRRAFCLKQSYLNYKLGFTGMVSGPRVILTPPKGKGIEQFVMDEMNGYAGRNAGDIAQELGRTDIYRIMPKSHNALLAKLLLKSILADKVEPSEGFDTHFEQFEKAGIIMKAVCLESDGRLIESISFPAFKWIDLAAEEVWEDSELYGQVTSKFLFLVFRKQQDSEERKFEGAFFWTMPSSDIEDMRKLWADTIGKIRGGDYSQFLKKSQHPVGHVRPHARDKADTFPTPQGGAETKKSFWLNNDYIRELIRKFAPSIFS